MIKTARAWGLVSTFVVWSFLCETGVHAQHADHAGHAMSSEQPKALTDASKRI